jgi:hypothetical protein
VDSTYTLLKHRAEITHAILVHGCDMPLENSAYRSRAAARLGETAAALGVKLVEIETDLLRFSDAYAHWGYHYHGAGLTALAMLLSGGIRRIFIAASDLYSAMLPWGSSFLTDPLWNTPLLGIIHDGAEAGRMKKLEKVAEHPLALNNLRVCFGCPDEGLNCGRCEKCYRTMVSLRVIGALDKCSAFGRDLDLETMVNDPKTQSAVGRLLGWRISREEAERRAADPTLIHALRELFLRSSYQKMVREFAQHKKEIIDSPDWRESLPKFRAALLESLRREDPAWFAERILQWLPAVRDDAFARLYQLDRPWFKKSCWQARLGRIREKFRRRRKDPPG